ncbi:fumarate/nitrate reduction transcriptional regulator Fnr [Aquirhabdus parva]|uniref:Fumarate/nitrate reduction transcriptional regulator Fnr n=1 Tax=Aquirhabdus parva TaxID=2283318 RepID=A0A345P7N6_9GAMM|nr:fumarate/nitrate reduction transcriptional regulator Fnr [Aquirhabdus parva]AXI03295.1 fumarate/nitrate reduction transcriptional regulator Fnr [Aquirhabdus parva]
MDIKHLNLRESRAAHCSDCALNPICLPPALADEDLDQLENIIGRNRPIPRGGVLFRQGTPFEAIYAVRSGAIKTYSTAANGAEQITGFYLPGEIVGLDSIGNPAYESTATALGTTAICAIPFDALEVLSMKHVSLHHHLFKLMSSEIRNDHQIMQMVGKRPAEEKVATLLLSFTTRHKRRKLNENHIYLPMSRADIGNHLGLALETVSRIFTHFQEIGVIAVNGKDVTILDRTTLCALADPV